MVIMKGTTGITIRALQDIDHTPGAGKSEGNRTHRLS